jgi:two-component system chemotaxis response regulator CheY
MKILSVEDDYITSLVLHEILMSFGKCDIAQNGLVAIELFSEALSKKEPYDIIFLDIMMPEMDGQEVLKKIREIEGDNQINGLDSVKVIMTTALDDFENINSAFKHQCEGYIVKPINKDKITQMLIKQGLLE